MFVMCQGNTAVQYKIIHHVPEAFLEVHLLRLTSRLLRLPPCIIMCASQMEKQRQREVTHWRPDE